MRECYRWRAALPPVMALGKASFCVSLAVRRSRCWLALGCALLLAGCSLLRPSAPGLIDANWVAKTYQRQDQVDIAIAGRSVSFLLYQRQREKALTLLAVSLTGQTLFELRYDGAALVVVERLPSMRHLPFEFLARDILLASDKSFTPSPWRRVATDVGQQLWLGDQHILTLTQQGQQIELHNLQVPYQLRLQPLTETDAAQSSWQPSQTQSTQWFEIGMAL